MAMPAHPANNDEVIMEVDVEIQLPPASSSRDYGLDGFLPNGYFLEERGTRKKMCFLRGTTSTGERIDETVSRFLSDLHCLEKKLRKLKAELRVGVFYSVAETAVFPFRLGVDCIAGIVRCGLALDAIIYVCGEDEPSAPKGRILLGGGSNE
jgi:hypothetical protein